MRYPRFKEEVLSERLGEPLKGVQVSPAIVSQVVEALKDDQGRMEDRAKTERSRLEGRMTLIRNRMDAAYTDKLDGKVTEDFRQRKMGDWQLEEQRAGMALDGLTLAGMSNWALDAEKVFDLANHAYYLYLSQDPTEKAKLLRMMCANFSVDGLSVAPTYRYPFNLISQRAKMEEWSGRLDSN